MPPVTSTEQARELLRQVATTDPLALTEFPDGWTARRSLLPGDPRAVGLGAFVVDRQTGTVTVHPSLPIQLVASRYTQQIQAQAHPTGTQIWPWTTTSVTQHVSALLMTASPPPMRTLEIRVDLWTVTPEVTRTRTPLTYVVDGTTRTIWAYETRPAVATTYLVERKAGRITGTAVFPTT